MEQNRKNLGKILNWEDKLKSSIFLVSFIFIVWNFELWMVPFALIFSLLREGLNKVLTGNWETKIDDILEVNEETEEDKTSILENILSTAFSIQETLGSIASFLESIENVFIFNVPFLSFICLVVMILISFVMYLLPLRVIIILWGFHKITKKLIRPWATSNNEITDFLDRVPDRVEMMMYQEI